MDYRTLLVAATLAAGLSAVGTSRADVIATDTGISVKESDVPTPRRGMTMEQVASKFGAPVSKTAAVGKPPISRWEYSGFVVYFEHEHVIHSVVAAGDAPPTAAPAASAPETPAAEAPAAPAEAAPAASPDGATSSN